MFFLTCSVAFHKCTCRLERDKDALYTALAVTTSLPDKAGRMSELQIIKDDVQEFSSDVKEYVSTVKVSGMACSTFLVCILNRGSLLGLA